MSDAERLYLIVLYTARRLRDIDVSVGISPTRFSAIASLMFKGEMNIGQLAKIEHVSRPAMTRLVRDLESDGLVQKSADPSDGRGVVVSPTDEGRRIVTKCREQKIDFVRLFLAQQPKEVTEAIVSVLDPLEELAGGI